MLICKRFWIFLISVKIFFLPFTWNSGLLFVQLLSYNWPNQFLQNHDFFFKENTHCSVKFSLFKIWINCSLFYWSSLLMLHHLKIVWEKIVKHYKTNVQMFLMLSSKRVKRDVKIFYVKIMENWRVYLRPTKGVKADVIKIVY